jgi:hypothetical protein
VPTWRNGRVGQDSIARRLDRFLVSEDLLIASGLYNSWVELPFISDHAPILLQLEAPPNYKIYPFKFNPQWISEVGFGELVFKVWNDPMFLAENGKQCRILWKLKELKRRTKIWLKALVKEKKEKLVALESEIKDKNKLLESDISNNALVVSLRLLEGERNEILKSEEYQWRLRSRALWLSGGDKNSKFFHSYASAKRVQKHIWKIKLGPDSIATEQNSIKEAVVHYFKDFFKSSNEQVMPDQCKLCRILPSDDE